MHASLGDDFSVEVSELFDQPDIFQKRWSTPAGGQNVGVICYGRASGVRENLPATHNLLSLTEIECIRHRDTRTSRLTTAAIANYRPTTVPVLEQ